MNNNQLEEHYFNACYHYAKNNSITDPIMAENPMDNFVVLVSIDSKVNIHRWNHDSPQPDETTLKSYTVRQVTDTMNTFLKQEYKNGNRQISLSENTTYSFSGPWASNQDINIGLSLINNRVTIQLPTVSIAGNSTSVAIESTSNIPFFYRPSTEQTFIIAVKNANTVQMGCCMIGTDGSIHIHSNLACDPFTSSTDNHGFLATSVSYLL